MADVIIAILLNYCYNIYSYHLFINIFIKIIHSRQLNGFKRLRIHYTIKYSLRGIYTDHRGYNQVDVYIIITLGLLSSYRRWTKYSKIDDLLIILLRNSLNI